MEWKEETTGRSSGRNGSRGEEGDREERGKDTKHFD
jgi:hypothetical protein